MSAASGLCIGIDLGGTRIKCALGRPRHDLVWTHEIPSRVDEGRTAVERALLEAADVAREEAARRGEPVRGLCIASPGIVNPETGHIPAGTPNLPEWDQANLPALFLEHTGLSIVVENDANAATYAEAGWGAGEGADDVLMVTVGTGIGGGAIVNGKLLRGSGGAGMEIGHMTAPHLPAVFDEDPPPMCSCGRVGCLEAYTGGWALLKRWRDHLASASTSTSDQEPPSVRQLLQAGQAGDPAATAILRRAAQRLGYGLRTAVQLVDPVVVIVGGGVVDGFPQLVTDVTEVLKATRVAATCGNPRVCKARFGNQAGMLGAIALAAEASGHV